MSTYAAFCDGDFASAIALYRWNATITAAFWEPIGHLEVALRNTLAAQLAARHQRLRRPGEWLDDPELELSDRARGVIGAARARVRQKGKRASEGQMISELSLGFWRFLVTKKLTGLWPDPASAFPHAPDRKRETVEGPVARLHDFRNRLAHHHRIWNRSPVARYEDLMVVAGYIDADLPTWIDSNSSVPNLLRGDWALTRAKAMARGVEPVYASQQVPSKETSAEAILVRVGGKRMSREEFDKHFGDLPTDGEG